MTTAQRSPGLAAAFLAALREDRVGLRTAMPASVVSFDASSQTVSVQPGFKRLHATRGEVSYPVLPNVRVQLPAGGGFGLSLPLAVGNTGVLIFCERTLDRWNVVGAESDPEDDELHGLNGAIFVPGIHPDDAVPANVDATDMVLGQQNGVREIRIDPSGHVTIKGVNIKLGDETASHPLSHGDTVSSLINGLIQLLTTMAPIGFAGIPVVFATDVTGSAVGAGYGAGGVVAVSASMAVDLAANTSAKVDTE